MHRCPKCKGGDIHRSRAKSTWEGWRKKLTGKRPFRCMACGWRGWAVDVGPTFSDAERKAAERAIAPEPPNLQASFLAREPERSPDVNLQALDVLETVETKKPADVS
jgi:hypothetical protein